MGINVIRAIARSRRVGGGAAPAVVGAEPPYTLALGGAPQPDLDITFAAQPWTALPAQLLNAPQGKLIAEGARSALEHN
eukprot:952288-Pyramimonas_sp.AAC.1